MTPRERQPGEGPPKAGQGVEFAVAHSPVHHPAHGLAQPSAARQRKLHVGHFAFMRSVVQGLDPRESWERYFRFEGQATDQRTVRATIAWIRDEFAAKREDRFGTACLVRLDATRIADPSLQLPSLEAFADGAAQGRGHCEGRPRLPPAAAARLNTRLRPGLRGALFIAGPTTASFLVRFV